jgi:hypothetical protein
MTFAANCRRRLPTKPRLHRVTRSHTTHSTPYTNSSRPYRLFHRRAALAHWRVFVAVTQHARPRTRITLHTTHTRQTSDVSRHPRTRLESHARARPLRLRQEPLSRTATFSPPHARSHSHVSASGSAAACFSSRARGAAMHSRGASSPFDTVHVGRQLRLLPSHAPPAAPARAPSAALPTGCARASCQAQCARSRRRRTC